MSHPAVSDRRGHILRLDGIVAPDAGLLSMPNNNYLGELLEERNTIQPLRV